MPTAASDGAPAMDAAELGDLLLEVLPPDGSAMANSTAREALARVAERPISEAEYRQIREEI